MAFTTINKGSNYFNTKLYTGTGAAQSLTGVGFQPDFTWFDCRSTGNDTILFDAVRGATKSLYSDLTNAEQTNTAALVSFDSDGFSLGGASGDTNDNGASYLAWNWLASNTSGSSNTDGSITSTVSANTTAGFSIVRYTGTASNATVGHGLGVAPKFIIFKDTTNAGTNWSIYHKSMTAGYRLTLNDTSARTGPDSTYYQSTDPTSSVFYIGTNSRANASGAVTIAYCFANVKGFSRFGRYWGNGNADGTFVYTGFKPSYVLIKNMDGAGYSWLVHDNKRPGYNSTDIISEVDLNVAEKTGYHMDFLSNGFKHRITSGSSNANSNLYMYAAFAEHPLVGTNGVPATAR